jgi:hypothetical protein
MADGSFGASCLTARFPRRRAKFSKIPVEKKKAAGNLNLREESNSVASQRNKAEMAASSSAAEVERLRRKNVISAGFFLYYLLITRPH